MFVVPVSPVEHKTLHVRLGCLYDIDMAVMMEVRTVELAFPGGNRFAFALIACFITRRLSHFIFLMSAAAVRLVVCDVWLLSLIHISEPTRPY